MRTERVYSDVVSTVDRARSASEYVGDRLEFETLLAELSFRFINLPSGDVDREIEDALRRVCEFVGIDLAVLWQWSGAAPGFVIPTHTYCIEERLRPSEPMREADYPWAVQQVLAGRTFAIPSLDDYPPEAAVDRQTARRHGVKSGVCLPLMVGGGPPVGALGLNVMREERDWPDALVKRLELVAQVFSNALARTRADQALRESEARLASGADLAGLAFYQVDMHTGIAFFDARLLDLCGVPPDMTHGLQPLEFWLEHVHPDDRPSVIDARQHLHDGRTERISLEYRYRHPVRGELWLRHLGRVSERDATGVAVKGYGVLRDITERKRAEDDLRSLSRRLIRAQEAERAMIARELHDDVTQRLAVLAIDAGRAELAGPGAVQADAIRLVREGLIRLSEDIHSLAYQLHPSVLEELGLAEALRTECERQGRHSGVALSLNLEPLPPVVERDVALCLYRVAQEALNNVIHHARARKATVILRQLDGGLALAVRDDGEGFDPEHPREGRSLGLASMRERLRLVNGTLDIESAPGHGTAIVAWVPVKGDAS